MSLSSSLVVSFALSSHLQLKLRKFISSLRVRCLESFQLILHSHSRVAHRSLSTAIRAKNAQHNTQCSPRDAASPSATSQPHDSSRQDRHAACRSTPAGLTGVPAVNARCGRNISTAKIRRRRKEKRNTHNSSHFHLFSPLFFSSLIFSLSPSVRRFSRSQLT